MYLANALSELFFQTEANGDANIIVDIPSNINKILVVLNTIEPDVSIPDFFLMQTGNASAFDSSGYQSGAMISVYSSNSWVNNNSNQGFVLNKEPVNINVLTSGVYTVANLNNSTPGIYPSFTGIENTVGTQGNPSSNLLCGLSPTSNASRIQFQWQNGNIASGIITVYSLL